MNNDEDKLINQLINRGPGVKDQKRTTCNHQNLEVQTHAVQILDQK